MKIIVTVEDLPTVAEHDSVVTVSGRVIGSSGARKVTFEGDRERMARLLAVVAGTGEAVATVEPWQILGDVR